MLLITYLDGKVEKKKRKQKLVGIAFDANSEGTRNHELSMRRRVQPFEG